jgi:hypothetical protein
MATGWLAFEYGVTGELYYAVDQSLSTAWTNQYAFTNNGDGNLFYPGNPQVIGGTDPIPVESMRLKLIRDGYQDYEYLHFLATHGQASQARTIAQGLFPVMYDTARSDAQVQAVRLKLEQAVEKIVGAPPTSGSGGGGQSTGGGGGASSGGTGGSTSTAVVGPSSGEPGTGGGSGAGQTATQPLCLVPSLTHLRLRAARRVLKRSHCRLGKVHRPRHLRRGGKLRIGTQSVPAGRARPDGFAVDVGLRAAGR